MAKKKRGGFGRFLGALTGTPYERLLKQVEKLASEHADDERKLGKALKKLVDVVGTAYEEEEIDEDEHDLVIEAIEEADIVVIDSASSLMPDGMNDQARFDMIQRLRKIASTGRSLMLNVDRDEMDVKLLHSLRASAEVVLDLSTNLIGGDLKRTLLVTRYLRAAGPVQSSIGWRVEPGMGFIVDITAVS